MKTDNELIANFMGGVLYGPDDLDHPNKWWFQNQPHEGYRKDAHHISDFLRYDKDWSWLMPVVEKINSIGYDVLINATGIHNEMHSCDITTTTDVQAATTSKVLIECVYKSVVEFIKWHNNVSPDKKQ